MLTQQNFSILKLFELWTSFTPQHLQQEVHWFTLRLILAKDFSTIEQSRQIRAAQSLCAAPDPYLGLKPVLAALCTKD